MEKIIIPLIFFCMVGFTGIALLIFFWRKKDNGYDYDKIISLMNKQTEKNLDILSKYNKEKNLIEEKILKCKKELNLKLYRN